MAKGKNIKGQGGEDSSLDGSAGQAWRQPDLLWGMNSDGDGRTKTQTSPDKLRRSKKRLKGKSAAKTKKLQKTQYEIGYAKPPAKSQFKPGQSGNVKGRPRKKPKPSGVPQDSEQRYKNIFLEEAYRTIPIREGDKTIKIPFIQAVMRRMGHDALRGDHKALKMYLSAAQEIENKNYQEHLDWLDTILAWKWKCEAELKYCKRHNLVPPEMIPHPDNIILHPKTGLVHVIGPMTKEGMVIFRGVHQFIKNQETEMSDCIEYMKENGETESGRQNLESIRGVLERFKHEYSRVYEWIDNGAL